MRDRSELADRKSLRKHNFTNKLSLSFLTSESSMGK